MRSAFLLICIAALACGKKNKPVETAAETPPPKEAAKITAEMPDTAEAKAFAKRLVAITVTNFAPESAAGAEFSYDTLKFEAPGTWSASGAVTADFEKMECTETGTWKIDEATSNEVATMIWTLGKTNCAGRESGKEQRVQMTVQNDGSYQINFR